MYTTVLSVIFCFFSWCLGQELEGVSINKPRNRVQPPWVQLISSTDHVTCFCNLPPCVGTGYMCKSSYGGCFSDLSDSHSSTYRGRHGCIEYLTESQRTRCPISDHDGQTHKQEKGHPKSLLVCCTNDMCNHIDNPNTRNLLNFTGDDTESKYQRQTQEAFLYTNSEVWFRAATIAVPICGAVILFALIALAVKILKSENQNSMHHKLGPAMYVVPSDQKHSKWSDNPYKPCTIKRPYHQAHPSVFGLARPEDDPSRQFQIPLLVTNEMREFNNVNSDSRFQNCSTSENKNDTNAKMNLIESSSIILELGKSGDFNLANINLGGDKFDGDKVFIA